MERAQDLRADHLSKHDHPGADGDILQGKGMLSHYQWSEAREARTDREDNLVANPFPGTRV